MLLHHVWKDAQITVGKSWCHQMQEIDPQQQISSEVQQEFLRFLLIYSLALRCWCLFQIGFTHEVGDLGFKIEGYQLTTNLNSQLHVVQKMHICTFAHMRQEKQL